AVGDDDVVPVLERVVVARVIADPGRGAAGDPGARAVDALGADGVVAGGHAAGEGVPAGAAALEVDHQPVDGAGAHPERVGGAERAGGGAAGGQLVPTGGEAARQRR